MFKKKVNFPNNQCITKLGHGTAALSRQIPFISASATHHAPQHCHVNSHSNAAPHRDEEEEALHASYARVLADQVRFATVLEMNRSGLAVQRPVADRIDEVTRLLIQYFLSRSQLDVCHVGDAPPGHSEHVRAQLVDGIRIVVILLIAPGVN